MDVAQFNTDIFPKINQCREHLEHISSKLGDKNSIVLVESQGLFEDALYGFQRILRKLPADKGLDLILESHGGSSDAATAITSLCRERFGQLRVPSSASSSKPNDVVSCALNKGGFGAGRSYERQVCKDGYG